jgi:hypothetical protein
MGGLVIGNPATDLGRPFRLAAAHGFEQILKAKGPIGDASLASGIAYPALDVGTGVTAGGQSSSAQVYAFQVAGVVGAEDPD